MMHAKRWQDFASDAPEIADLGRRLFRKYGLAYLATTKPDGGPRLHPLTPILNDGGLYLGIIQKTSKHSDLVRDGRIVLHALPGPEHAEFALDGVAMVIAGDELQRLSGNFPALRLPAGDTLFEVGIRSAYSVTYTADGNGMPVPCRRRWRSSKPAQCGGAIRAPIIATGNHSIYDALFGSASDVTPQWVDWQDLNDDHRSGVILVVASSHDEAREFQLSNSSTGRVELPVVVGATQVSLGPSGSSDADCGYKAFYTRLIASDQRIIDSGAYPTGDDATWVAGQVLEELAALQSGSPKTRNAELFLRVAERLVSRQTILPLPWVPTASGADDEVPRDVLIDRRLGLVTNFVMINHHKSVPPTMQTVQAAVINMRRVSPWLTDPMTSGTSFRSRDEATDAAFGEAVERYSGEIVQEKLLRAASWEQLTAAGEHACDPHQLVLFSDAQYSADGFPFMPLRRGTEIYWVRAYSLTKKRDAWIPASLAYPNFYTGRFADLKPNNNPFYPGLAAGPTLEYAVRSGIQEVIERHATMVWWSAAYPLPSVQQSAPMRQLWRESPESSCQRAWLVHLDNEFGVPVFAGMVRHESEKLFTMGFGARPSPSSAALKAWQEALTLQEMARDLDNPDGGYRRAVQRGDVNGRLVKPWRRDRAYLDSYREDLRDVVDLTSQVQIHLDPRAFDRVRHIVDTEASRTLDDLPRLDGNSLEEIQEKVERRGYEIFYADLTTPDVRATHYRAVRVVIPGLVPNFASGFPFLGRNAILEASTRLGWKVGPTTERELNVFPMAHA